MSTPYIQLKLVEVTKETDEAATLHFEHPDKKTIPSVPGQFLTLILPVEGKKVRRAYSLSSCMFEGTRLSVTIKRVPGGLVSNYLLDQAKVGDQFEALQPIGNFTLKTDPANSRHIVLIGAGSGISPLMSILKAALAKEPGSKVYLIYGNRDESSIIFKSQLQQLEQQHEGRLYVLHVLSQPKQPTDAEHSGRLNRSKLLRILEKLGLTSFQNTVYYTCGPEGLMDEVKEAAKLMRIPQDRLLKESFVSTLTEPETHGEVSTAANDDSGAQTVTVTYEGAEYKFEVKPGQTILDAALDLDIDLPYSCQSGLCTACRGKCLSGKVHLDEREGLSDMEIKEGYVLTCVGRPVTHDVVIEIG